MKKILILTLFILIAIGCSKSKSGYTNPYLPNNPVNIIIDLNFPQYDNLKYAHGSAIVPNQGAGGSQGGVVVFNLGGDDFRAYDIICPNHQIDYNCSRMKMDKPGSIYISCHCTQYHEEPLKYSLITGTSMTPGAQYQMKPYPVVKRGNIITINY
ncbi:MAG: hypothetical protein LBI72_09530 [Flavobacteriaceae bacterium]|jgi:nitrite reductase/ring-hydroxylating ferredoxin subunit|nr:hypothetical protein [Flavobacteriaceae bacterium]